MIWKQHRNSKSRLLAVLFLFFNCVCAAAPVAKLTDDNFKDAISVRIGIPLENEEEAHFASGYISHTTHFSVGKKNCKQKNHHFFSNQHSDLIASVESSNTFIYRDSNLPLQGNYAFLFRYTLF